jgi:hypothetical protein
MKTIAAIALLSLSMPVIACDWVVTKTPDPMTDTARCLVSSASGKVSFYRYGTDRPNVMVASAYPNRQGLYVRVDDNKAIQMGDDAYFRSKALDALLPQIKTGKRLRVVFSDYPQNQTGDTQICNLVELLDACPETAN